MGLEINIQMPCSISKIVSLFLSSLMLIDAAYVSSCNIRDNKAISLFCGLLALDGWYMLLSVSDNAIADIVFYLKSGYMVRFHKFHTYVFISGERL